MHIGLKTSVRAAASASVAVLALGVPAAPVAPATAGSGEGAAAGGFSVDGDTATFPLREGRTADGRRFWYVAVEASDLNAASRFGVRVVNKLRNAAGTGGVDHGRLVNGVLVTHGSVDFAPQRTVVGTAGSGFPPVTARPGSRGDAAYTPLVELPDGSVLNAPVVANDTGVHDKVLAIDRQAHRVTLQLTRGFARGNPVRYLSTDATAEGPAALEGATFAPRLVQVPSAGDDSTDSARAGLAAFVNGPSGADNPQRQGLNSALLGEGDPLNVLAWLPGQGRYSSLWDVHLTAWATGMTPRRARRFDQVEDLAAARKVTAVNGGRWVADNIIVNCPILALG